MVQATCRQLSPSPLPVAYPRYLKYTFIKATQRYRLFPFPGGCDIEADLPTGPSAALRLAQPGGELPAPGFPVAQGSNPCRRPIRIGLEKDVQASAQGRGALSTAHRGPGGAAFGAALRET